MHKLTSYSGEPRPDCNSAYEPDVKHGSQLLVGSIRLSEPRITHRGLTVESAGRQSARIGKTVNFTNTVLCMNKSNAVARTILTLSLPMGPECSCYDRALRSINEGL